MDRCRDAGCRPAAQGIESRETRRRLHSQDPRQFRNRLAGEKIHRADTLELYTIDRALVSALVARLDRRVALSVSIAERELYVAIGTENLHGPVVRLHLDV